MRERDLVNRCLRLLEGREPEEWPVPIAKADLRELLEFVTEELDNSTPPTLRKRPIAEASGTAGEN